jgi:paraquat-inducible protein B
MADPPIEGAPTDLPEAIAAPPHRWAPSIVWLVPIVAAAIGAWLAVHALLERGPDITVMFKSAEGIEAGKTKIKYKSVDVGQVTTISIGKDREHVVVRARMTKDAESFLRSDTQFWVVRPRIAGGSVSGLSTLLGGTFIGMDAGNAGDSQRDFKGLEVPPAVTPGVPGRQFVLRGADLGSLEVGTPVYFRRVEVGRVVAFSLDKDGHGVTVKVFVDAPYDQYVNYNSRFWQASGVDLTLNASGVKLDTQSLVSILIGGLAFETLPDAPLSTPAEPEASFELFDSRAAAFAPSTAGYHTFVLYFSESVRGLEKGAPVDFRGVNLGEVHSVDIEFDRATKTVRIPVVVRLYPDRLLRRELRRTVTVDQIERREVVDTMIARGMRAQLRTGSLLTGQLYVALDFFPHAKPAQVDWTAVPPTIPTVPGSLTNLETSLTSVVDKLDKIPFEAIAKDLQVALRQLDSALKSAEQLVQRVDTELTPEAKDALVEAKRALAAAGRVMASDSPLQEDARQALGEITRAAKSLRVLTDYLERHPESLIRGKSAVEKP